MHADVEPFPISTTIGEKIYTVSPSAGQLPGFGTAARSSAQGRSRSWSARPRKYSGQPRDVFHRRPAGRQFAGTCRYTASISLAAAGIRVSRLADTGYKPSACSSLYNAQFESVRHNRVKAMDDADRRTRGHGRMRTIISGPCMQAR